MLSADGAMINIWSSLHKKRHSSDSFRSGAACPREQQSEESANQMGIAITAHIDAVAAGLEQQVGGDTSVDLSPTGAVSNIFH